jgi:hypothetical protein
MANVIVYIDGFNLYYRALRNPAYKWLDVLALSRALFSDDNVQQVNYYTARIKPSKLDARKHVRQQIYFRALTTLPGVQLHYGNYVQNCAKMPLYDEWKSGVKKIVRVAKQEEKGSDVNLAAHLVRDGLLNRYEVAGVLTSDSDLAEPFRIVVEEIHLPLVLLHPYVPNETGEFREPTKDLRQHVGGAIKKVREGLLAACQLPEVVTDGVGEIRRPHEWY